jgi:hypothetical protein
MVKEQAVDSLSTRPTDLVIGLKINDIIVIIINLKDYACWPLQSSSKITQQFSLT